MSNKIAKSPLLGHSLENSLSKVLFPEELKMGWCPKAKFLILYETLAFSVRAQSLYTHELLEELLRFILHGIIKTKLSL